MPHRSRLFRDVATGIMLVQPDMRPFFEEVRADWRGRLDGEGNPETLQLLLERLNPQNYTEQPQGDGSVRFAFAWPEDIQRRNDAEERDREAQSRLMMFPWQCRQRLDGGTGLPHEELLAYWEALRAIDAGHAAPAMESGHALYHVEDAVCGGIAVLLILHRDWLAADPDRIAWCRQKLEQVIQHPPAWSPYDAESTIGNLHWDAFAAECGVALLVENREDPLGRELVALGVVAYRYATTALTMERAFRCRERLGEDFDRMLNLAVRWAGVRNLWHRASQLQFMDERWLEQRDRLIQVFVDRLLPAERPTLEEANATALAEINDLHARCFAGRQTKPRRRRRRASADRTTLRVGIPGIDLQVIASACAWLDLNAARSPDERRKWVVLIRELMETSLRLLPVIDDPRRQEIDGLPSDFDGWVYSLAARAIPHMTQAEDPDALWRPILELGPPAHHWVERFFWHWFTDGAQAAETPEAFTAPWERMLRHALASAIWNPVATRAHELGGMVFELLGFHFGLNSVGGDQRFAAALGEMADVFALTARRWFALPRVMSGFARFVVQPAVAQLLLPGVRWLWEGVCLVDAEDWRERNPEDNLVGVLHQCWERQSARVSGDRLLREAFLGLLTSVASRGGHAATALRDRVLDSIGAQA